MILLSLALLCSDVALAVTQWKFSASASALALQTVPYPELELEILVSKPVRRATLGFEALELNASELIVEVQVLRDGDFIEVYTQRLTRIRVHRWNGVLRRPNGRLRRFRLAAGDRIFVKLIPPAAELDQQLRVSLWATFDGKPERRPRRSAGLSEAPKTLREPAGGVAEVEWLLSAGTAFRVPPKDGRPHRSQARIRVPAASDDLLPCLGLQHLEGPPSGPSRVRAKVTQLDRDGRFVRRMPLIARFSKRATEPVCFPPVLEAEAGDLFKIRLKFLQLPAGRLFTSAFFGLRPESPTE